MKVTNIRKFESSLHFVSVLPRNNCPVNDPAKLSACLNDVTLQAYSQFVKDTNRYSTIPTPKFSECKILPDNGTIEFEDDVVIWSGQVTVIWYYEK